MSRNKPVFSSLISARFTPSGVCNICNILPLLKNPSHRPGGVGEGRGCRAKTLTGLGVKNSRPSLSAMNTFILIIGSGFAGAIAGGVVSFISSLFERKWKKEDQLRDLKISTYSEIISVAGEYLEENSFRKLNNLVAEALLICEQDVHIALISYMRNTASTHKKIVGKSLEERKKILTADVYRENGILHQKLVSLMKKELNLS